MKKLLVFVNNPIKNKESDILGITTESDRIEQAIKEGAHVIGIIGDYGSGKSSLIELLKSKFKKVININMWNSIPEKNDDDVVKILTKNFIFQLAIGKNERFAQYINKRLNKNYGILSLSISSMKYWKSGLSALTFYCIYKILLELPKNIYNTNLYLAISNNGSVDICNNDILKNIIIGLYGFSLDFKILFLMAAVIFLIRLLYKNVIAVISSWSSKGERKEEINDVYDVYLEVANEICEKNNSDEKTIIIIEDLDRSNKVKDVKDFIKEIYKFNNVLPETLKEKIVYIIAIKPEEGIEEIDKEKIYSKIFGYTSILNPIHNEDCKKILERLLEQKGNNNIVSTEKEMLEKFSYIIKGKNLTIRTIKDRLNRSLQIFDSLNSKKTNSDDNIILEKCSLCAYLESEFPNELSELIKNEDKFSEIMKESYKIKQDKTLLSEDKITKMILNFNEKIPNKFNEDFLKKIASYIVEDLIGEDFRMYFYNYPQGQKIKGNDEKYVEKLLLYNEENNIDEGKIQKVYEENKELIKECYLKRKNEKLLFYNVILKNKYLFEVAEEFFNDDLTELMKKEIIWDIKNIAESERKLRKIIEFDNKNINRVLEKYANDLIRNLIGLEEIEIIRVRKIIINTVKEKINILKNIFVENGMPLITEEELKMVETQLIKLDLINEKIIDENSVEYIANIINIKQNNCDRAIEIYLEMIKNIEPEKLVLYLLGFLTTNQIINEDFFEIIKNSYIINKGAN